MSGKDNRDNHYNISALAQHNQRNSTPLSDNNIGALVRRDRRSSVLISSNPTTDYSPIDCILVFDNNDDKDDNNQPEKKHQYSMPPSERRNRFEDYLVNKQNLTLEHVKSRSKRYEFVKVHTPFEILLLTAENMRMRLPIEKIEDENENQTTIVGKSCWQNFLTSVKKPFRIDSSLSKEDPDYYTAIYSSNIERFSYLFETLRGSKETYFTPTERSLLTYELLSRAHADDGDDGDDRSHSGERQVLNTVIALRTGSRRPGIDRLVAKKAYLRYFPLHEPLRDEVTSVPNGELNDREKLKKHWATMRKWYKFQPLSLIRSYMGEKVTFYFAFFGFYNLMLIPAAIAGLIIFIYGASTVYTDQPTSDICGDFGQQTYMCPRCDKICPFWKLSDSCVYSKISYVFDNASTVVFAIIMSLWARWCIEFWKRRQATLQYDWDSIDFEANLEPIRPEFEAQAMLNGEERMNPVTEIREPYIPSRKRVPYFIIGTVVVLITMAIVIGTVVGTIVYRVQMDYILKSTSVKSYSSIIITVTSALMNLICSLILSQLYYWLAKKLTNFELHKYQSKYDDSLIIKIYLFQFVNFYSSIFYIAFFKGRFGAYPSQYGETGSNDLSEQCDPAGCFVELSIQFVIIMTGQQIINGLLELFAATRRTIVRACSKSKKDQYEQWEIDNDLYDFDSTTLIDEYLELVIQYGFVTLFVVAFPLAPLFALINNAIEIRLDAWKLLSKYKRPIPFKASDIGIWSDIISAVSYISVLTNGIVIAWTSDFIPKMAYRTLQSTGTSLVGYMNWTLSSFSIAEYNLTGTMTSEVPSGLTYCRYSDFRESTGPNYSHTIVYWNIIAARLAFIIVFEHLIYFIIYLMQWLVPDVPKKVRNKIDHERYIDQRERWSSKTSEDKFKNALITSEALAKMLKYPNGPASSPLKFPSKTHIFQPNRRKIGVQKSPKYKQ